MASGECEYIRSDQSPRDDEYVGIRCLQVIEYLKWWEGITKAYSQIH